MKNVLLEISSLDIEQLARTSSKAAEVWRGLRQNRYRTVAVASMLDTFALIAGSAVSAVFFVHSFGLKYLHLVVLAICIVLILFTKILPGIWGISYKMFIAQNCAPFIIISQTMLRPFAGSFNTVLTALDATRFKKGELIANLEISTLARAALLDGKISQEQEQLIKRTLDLSGQAASHIMVKREAIHFLSIEMSLSEALIAAHFHNHTRFPLAKDGDIDKIIGYVNFKDIVGALRLNPENPTLGGIMRPLNFVNPTMPLSRLFRVLTGGYKHIAVVRDEFGKTQGMVTLENLVESLVGELKDEYDLPADYFIQVTEHSFRVGGGSAFRKLRLRVSDTLPDWDLTMDEWIQGLCAGKIPEGFKTEFEGVEFKVRRLSRGRVFDVFVTYKKEVTLPQ
jgi:CBS domain containing-hemolysin-like protein